MRRSGNPALIRRSVPIIVSNLGICAIVVATAVAGDPPTAVNRPNIIVILSDDAGYTEFGYTAAMHGRATSFETPRIDELAQQSVILTSGYVANSAVCSPSRAALLTGLYPSRFGYEDNISAGKNGEVDGLYDGQATIASELKSLGYSTAAMGKWHLGTRQTVNRPLDVGFDEFFGFLGGGRNYYRYSSGASFDLAMMRNNTSVEQTWATEGDQSLYDPVKGRYLTDALGEEAASYIQEHASNSEPFFLYVAFNATHTPKQYKQQDYDHFSHLPDGNERQVAAMALALDRAVGTIVDAVDSSGIADNTVIVYANDNGGAYPQHVNSPYYGHKGSFFEGGVRVPFLIRSPDLASGIYDRPVSTLDLLPTFISMAGGDVGALTTDGADVVPYLSGETSGDPHELLFWRGPNGRFAVRRGDWKLMSPGSANPFARLHNLTFNPRETSYYNSQYPEVVSELVRELTLWEAQLKKPEWGPLGIRNKNEFDHFVYRTDSATTGMWSTSGSWYQAGTTNAVQLMREDAYANAILEFGTRNDSDYTATNDMRRGTGYTFMLNQLRFTGDFAGAMNHSGMINGAELLLLKNLDQQLPQIRIEATSHGSANFSFQLDTDLQLLDDLEITGNGTQHLLISGDITDYYESRRVIKSGTSSVTLAGNNTFGGGLTIHGGRVAAANLGGSVENNAGTFAPGTSIGAVTVDGDFSQSNGTLEIELGGSIPGTEYDKVAASGVVSLGGVLDVKLVDDFTPAIGDTFQFLTAAGGLMGTFDALLLPALTDGMWTTIYGSTSVSLHVVMDGDFNDDGIVDAADYVTLRKAGLSASDYDKWRSNFGTAAGDGAAADSTNGPSVPEPSMVASLIAIVSAVLIRRVQRTPVRQ